MIFGPDFIQLVVEARRVDGSQLIGELYKLPAETNDSGHDPDEEQDQANSGKRLLTPEDEGEGQSQTESRKRANI